MKQCTIDTLTIRIQCQKIYYNKSTRIIKKYNTQHALDREEQQIPNCNIEWKGLASKS